MQDAALGGYLRADLDEDDVARDEFARIYLALASLTKHARAGAREAAQGLDRALRLELLTEAESGVDERTAAITAASMNSSSTTVTSAATSRM